jgi:cholest-4-en-3-one 26-monooxygenase
VLTSASPSSFDFTDPDVNQAGRPLPEFARARETAPITWVRRDADACAGMLGPEGYWAVTTHKIVSAVSRDSKNFSTARNGAIIRFVPDMTREQVELQSSMLINQDAPEHTRMRQIVSRGFTPRSILALRDDLASRARVIVESCAGRGDA